MKVIVYRVLLALLLFCLIFLLAFINGVWHEREMFVIIGNLLQIVIPCVGCYISLIRKDTAGIKQFLYTGLVTALITHAIKWATYHMEIGIRPSGGTKSFPSGHTSCSFQGALFLSKRYGRKWGIPTLVFAGLAAYSRIYGQYHHWRDVIVGFFIAFFVNKLFVTPLRAPRP
ncbi:MAG: phosphatase PAP2 family protein [Puniceicoccales bacterium]|jgi:membrane-associated phospholipid phosphatase|nr:phosphatase PAP2 family protein [Puniceicoccales bacterium]